MFKSILVLCFFETSQVVCDVIINQSCTFTFHVNQSSLNIVDENCKIFQDGVLWNKSLGELLSSSAQKHKGYLSICADDLIVDISNSFSDTSFEESRKRNIESKSSQNKCIQSLVVVWEHFPSLRRPMSGNSSGKLKRTSRHVENERKNRYVRREMNRSRNMPTLLKSEARKCSKIQRIFGTKRRFLCKRSRRDRAQTKLRRLLKKLRRQCTRINKKRNKRRGFQVNRTELNQPARKRSGPRPRNRRSVATNKWIKSIQLCKTDNLNESFTLKRLSRQDANFDTQNLDIRWLQNSSSGNNNTAFQFTFPDTEAKSENKALDFEALLNGSSTSIEVTGKPTGTKGVENENPVLIIIVVILAAVVLGIISVALYMRRCRNSIPRASVEGIQESGDTFSERSSYDDDHEMAVRQVTPGKTSKSYMKNLCNYNVNQRDCDMPTCHNNNRSTTPKSRSSKSGSRRRNPNSSDVYCGSQSERSHLNSATSGMNYPEPFSQGASNRNAQTHFDKFNRRFNNNPHRTSVTYLTKDQLPSVNYPPPVRRFPTRSGVENSRRVGMESNRFQTPPNRYILKNDGHKIESCYLGQYYVQTEPSPCASTNSDISPPSYSPRSGSDQSQGYASVSHLNNERTYRNSNHDLPPEYSEPPSYST